jgi:hypothetical protein
MLGGMIPEAPEEGAAPPPVVVPVAIQELEQGEIDRMFSG